MRLNTKYAAALLTLTVAVYSALVPAYAVASDGIHIAGFDMTTHPQDEVIFNCDSDLSQDGDTGYPFFEIDDANGNEVDRINTCGPTEGPAVVNAAGFNTTGPLEVYYYDADTYPYTGPGTGLHEIIGLNGFFLNCQQGSDPNGDDTYAYFSRSGPSVAGTCAYQPGPGPATTSPTYDPLPGEEGLVIVWIVVCLGAVWLILAI